MKKSILCFLTVFFIYCLSAAGAQATPFRLHENSNSLNSNNVWTDGEVYSFLGSDIELTAGQYDLTFNLDGKVWQKGDGDGWESSDKIMVEVFLNDSILSSTIGSGFRGQQKPFDLSLALNFDLSTDGILDIHVYSDVSSAKERWSLVDASLSGYYFDSYYEENSIVPTPEPATMLLLGFGLAGIAGFGRKKFLNR